MECVRVIPESKPEKPKNRGHIASGKTVPRQPPSMVSRDCSRRCLRPSSVGNGQSLPYSACLKHGSHRYALNVELT